MNANNARQAYTASTRLEETTLVAAIAIQILGKAADRRRFNSQQSKGWYWMGMGWARSRRRPPCVLDREVR